jgi:hypothetical protein
MLKRVGLVVLALIGSLGSGIGVHQFAPAGIGLIATAEARVGRPLTPMSVAGVARRTARRCAAGVYYC